MDVTFRESVPFYGKRTDLSFMFEPKLFRVDKATREGESIDVESNSTNKQSSIEGVISSVAPQSRSRGKEILELSGSDIRISQRYIQGKGLGLRKSQQRWFHQLQCMTVTRR